MALDQLYMKLHSVFFTVRLPDKNGLIEIVSFFNKTFKSLHNEHKTELCSTNRDQRAVFLEKLN